MEVTYLLREEVQEGIAHGEFDADFVPLEDFDDCLETVRDFLPPVLGIEVVT